MTFQDVQQYLRRYGGIIGRSARRGDELAARLETAYRALHVSPFDVKLQNELIKIVEDYIRRSCTITELQELERKYGIIAPSALGG